MKKRMLMLLVAIVSILHACKNHSSYEAMSIDSVSLRPVDSVADSSKLIKTAEMRFKVKSVIQSTQAITQLTKHYAGVITHHETATDIEQSHDIKLSDDSIMRVTAQQTSARMLIKVPCEHLDEYMNEVSKLGLYVDFRRMNVEDKTFDYLASKLKLQNRTQLLQQQKSGKVIIKDPSDVVYLKDDIIDSEIYNMKVDDRVKYSVVNLSYYQSNTITKEVVANDDPSDYNIGFGKRLGLAMDNGWYLFKEVIIAIANLWVCIIAGITLWLLIRWFRQRKIKV